MDLTKRSGGWIPREALIEVDTNTKKVNLLKPTADQLNGRITKGKLVNNSAEKMVIRWTVKGTRGRGNQTTPAFTFRALVKQKTGDVSVIAKPLGYSNDFRSKGTCKIKQG